MKKQKRIGILTGGGDCPGLNAVIRAVTKKAILEYGHEVIGIVDGYDGLIHKKVKQLGVADVSGILTLGGTILGTSNKANPYHYAVLKNEKVDYSDKSKEVVSYIKQLGIDVLVCIGGDGTLAIAKKLLDDSINVMGVPKTIDNDIRGSEVTFGFNTAVEIVTEGLDRIHTTAQSHHRVMIMEVMCRTAGWIALHAGIAGGGDIILLPEIPYDIEVITEKVKKRSKKGKRFSIIVVSEGAKPRGGDVVIRQIVKDSAETVRLGGISFVLAQQIEKLTNIEARAVVMGHIQRGGSPSAYDRVLATQFGTKVVDMIEAEKYGYMVGLGCNKLVEVPLEIVAEGPRLVPLDHLLIKSAQSIGVNFGI